MIRTERAHLTVAAQTHSGMTGKNNEDNFAVSSFIAAENNPTPVVFAIVADGIGGHRSGEVASEMVVNMVTEHVARSSGGNPVAIFQKAFFYTSNAIYERGHSERDHRGMGATCACALILGDRMFIAWAGDSRIYLVRNNQIFRLTRDHTWIQEALDKKILDPAIAPNHPNQHVIRRYLGSAEPPEPDLRLRMNPNETDSQAKANQGLILRQGDTIMLCSDGLTDLVADNEILAYLQTRDLNAAAKNLVDLANSRGGHDNITVVLLGVPVNTTTSPLRWLGWLMGER